MAKPFTVTFIEGVTETRLKPGWYKRAAGAARAAASRRSTTAPQHGDSRADDKAIEYARWLACRDGIELPNRHKPTVVWEACAAGMRPRSVVFFGQPGAPTVIGLPHWDYVAPEVVEVELREWAAPVVTEIEPVALIPAATIEAPEINVAPAETAAEAHFSTEPDFSGKISTPIPAAAVHFEPMAICPAVGMPCKVDCPHRAGCGPVRPAAPRPRPIPTAIAARALAASLRGSAAYHMGALR